MQLQNYEFRSRITRLTSLSQYHTVAANLSTFSTDGFDPDLDRHSNLLDRVIRRGGIGGTRRGIRRRKRVDIDFHRAEKLACPNETNFHSTSSVLGARAQTACCLSYYVRELSVAIATRFSGRRERQPPRISRLSEGYLHLSPRTARFIGGHRDSASVQEIFSATSN